MIRFLYFILFLVCFFSGFGQKNTFTVKTPDLHGGDSIMIPVSKKIFIDTTLRETGFKINRQTIYASTLGQKVITHYPDFDTIFYDNRNIISRFKPGANYVIVGACCLTNDILPEKEGDLFNQNDISFTGRGEWSEQKFDSIRNLYYDQYVGVRFSTKHQKKYEDHFAYFPEESGFPSIMILKNIEKNEFYYPSKGWFRSNFSSVLFSQLNDSIIKEINTYYQNTDTSDVIEDIFVSGVEWQASVSYRFFHNENIEIEYEPRTKNLKVKIVE